MAIQVLAIVLARQLGADTGVDAEFGVAVREQYAGSLTCCCCYLCYTRTVGCKLAHSW